MTDHPEIAQVDTLATDLLQQVREHHSGRTAQTLVTGTSQRVTLIALAEGAELAEHVNPHAATLYVVSGRVRLHTHADEWLLDVGHLVAMPPRRHGLHAMTDAAVLLTVALR
jgi:quercetin dioxygenase-like cupin family protein